MLRYAEKLHFVGFLQGRKWLIYCVQCPEKRAKRQVQKKDPLIEAAPIDGFSVQEADSYLNTALEKATY